MLLLLNPHTYHLARPLILCTILIILFRRLHSSHIPARYFQRHSFCQTDENGSHNSKTFCHLSRRRTTPNHGTEMLPYSSNPLLSKSDADDTASRDFLSIQYLHAVSSRFQRLQTFSAASTRPFSAPYTAFPSHYLGGIHSFSFHMQPMSCTTLIFCQYRNSLRCSKSLRFFPGGKLFRVIN